jgi:hypothetical protein
MLPVKCAFNSGAYFFPAAGLGRPQSFPFFEEV